MTNQISADEFNLLVFRYLQESGFEHSAYVFSVESMLTATPAATADVPCGALISFVHKGLLFSQLEREVEEPKRAKLMANAQDKANSLSSDASILVLKGHQREAYSCAFNTSEGNILASGSGDSYGRIWILKADGTTDSRLLEHYSPAKQQIEEETSSAARKDVTSICWSPDGTVLATGAFDGRIRLWNREGEMVGSLIQHAGPVHAIRWSSKGKFLLSCSEDKTAIVWNVSTLSAVKSFEAHQARVLDVDWCPNSASAADGDDDVFASCSNDKTIAICRVSTGETWKYLAHDDEVNTVKWSPDGLLLASCSDDNLAKIWSFPTKQFPSDGTAPVSLDLRRHAKDIFTVRWSPTGPGSAHPNLPRRLATASSDATVSIWDPETGKVLHTIDKQSEAVYAIEFDPSGQHLLSGSFDGLANVTNVETGVLMKSVKVSAGIYDVSWNLRGDRFAVAQADGTISLVDF